MYYVPDYKLEPQESGRKGEIMISTDYFYRHDLLLSPDEHFALKDALGHRLMAFYNTNKIRPLEDYELKEFATTKRLYERIAGSSADRLLKIYQQILDNPPAGDECPF